MIAERILEAKGAKIKAWPVRSNRASELGHECLRYLVLNRTRWQEKTLHSADLQMVFDMGNAVERMCEDDLREANYRVLEQNRPFSWDKYEITGTIDMKLPLTAFELEAAIQAGQLPEDVAAKIRTIIGQYTSDASVLVVPAEIKSAAPHVWETINTVEDMKKHKYHYMRKCPAQLTLYLIMDGKEVGVFLFKNKQTGKIKDIWMTLDYEYAESLIKKAEAVNMGVGIWTAEGVLPDPMPYDDDICPNCAFEHICLPERVGKGVKVLDDAEMLELLEVYQRTKGPAKEFRQVDERLKKLLEGQDGIVIGDFFITGKWQKKTIYQYPPEIQAKYKDDSATYWKRSIVYTGGQTAEAEV